MTDFRWRAYSLAVAMLSLAPLSHAVEVTLLPRDIHGGDTSRATFSTGDVTFTPIIGTTPATFNGADLDRLGIDDQIGTNPAAFNDLDTDPNNGNEERLQLAFAPGSGLSQLGWDYARADGTAPSGITITGFLADPQASFSENSSTLTASYDAVAGSLLFVLPGQQFSGALRTINFANPSASFGQTLLISVVDTDQAGAQFPIRQIKYESQSSIYAGDVTGNGVVDLADYDAIRNNILGTFNLTTSRASGDLSRNGFVGIGDFLLWKEAYKALNPGVTFVDSLSVPEPSTWVVLAIASAMVGVFRRHMRKFSGAVAALLLVALAGHVQAQVTVLPSDVPGGATSFTTTDGLLTLGGFLDGSPSGFNDNAQFFGVAGGLNNNAFDDQDGNPLTTSDQEELRLTFAASAGLSGLTFNYTQVVPMRLSGFQSDPLASFVTNPGGAASTVYDASSGSLFLFHPQFTAEQTQLAFANVSASANRTLSLVVWNFNGPLPSQSPQIAINAITYRPSLIGKPGDVNGDGLVNAVDFGVVRDNFLATNATRSQGDLTGDGRVTFDDFEQWQDNFSGNASLFAAQLANVPEPSAGLLLLGAVAVLRIRGARRS